MNPSVSPEERRRIEQEIRDFAARLHQLGVDMDQIDARRQPDEYRKAAMTRVSIRATLERLRKQLEGRK